MSSDKSDLEASGSEDRNGELARERQATLRVAIMLSFIGAFLAFGLVLGVSQLYPAKPYALYSSKVVPPSVCPGDKLRLSVDYSLTPYHKVKKTTITTEWVNVETGIAEEGGTDTIFDPSPMNRKERVLPIVSRAILDEGEYRLETRFDAVFNLYGFPRIQREVIRTTDSVIVLPEDHKKCRERLT